MSELVQVASDVLEATPARVALFLRGVALRVEIRDLLFAVGYTAGEQETAWNLLMATMESSEATPQRVEESGKARAALDALAGLDGSLFRRMHAVLGRFHPEQEAFLFDQIEEDGARPEVAIGKVCDRLEALAGSPERAGTREADRLALQTLAQRGMDAAFFDKLREVVVLAREVVPPAPQPPGPRSEKREKALLELHAWYKDWSETARAVIKRRDHLILLGLAKRRRRARGEQAPESVSVTVAEARPALAAGQTQTVTPPLLAAAS
jgi:hypothetical protein